MVRRAIEATLITTLLGFATAKIAELDRENQRLRAELARHEDHQSPVARLRGAYDYASGGPRWTVAREYRRGA
jgi:hypothetical protein